MAITTSTSIKLAKPPGPCVVCGHFGGLFVKTAQGGLVHAFDDCPVGPAPVAVDPTPIAYNALGEDGGASLPALERLHDLGRGLKKVISRPRFPVVHEAIGSFEPEVLELRMDVLRKQMALAEFQAVAPTGIVPEPATGETRYGSRPRKTR